MYFINFTDEKITITNKIVNNEHFAILSLN